MWFGQIVWLWIFAAVALLLCCWYQLLRLKGLAMEDELVLEWNMTKSLDEFGCHLTHTHVVVVWDAFDDFVCHSTHVRAYVVWEALDDFVCHSTQAQAGVEWECFDEFGDDYIMRRFAFTGKIT